MGRKSRVVRKSLVPVSVVSKYSYIDTICVVLPERMPKEMFRALRETLCAALRPRNRRYVLKKVSTANGYWIFKLTVHQPTPESVQILADAVETINARLLEVHLSLDLVTTSYVDSVALQDYLEERMLPSTRQNKPIERVKGTTYFNRKTRKGFEVALYSDKPSKITGEPCFHMDWRLIGAAILKRECLSTDSEILGLDHALFWDKKLALWLPPSLATIAKSRNKKAGSKQPDAVGSTKNQTHARLLLRSATSPRGVVVAHELLLLLRKNESDYNRRAMRLFSSELHNWMLPPKENALWM